MNVYILLDRSGSMSTLWNEALGAVNAYVAKLKKTDKVYLSVFDNEYSVVRDVKVKEWTDITNTDAQPRGMTALYDSCGKIMAKAEEDNAKKTILVVMTDGAENSSREHTQASIKAKVKEFEEKKWEVIFLGANFDSVEMVSGSVGVASGKTMNISATNLRSTMDSLFAYTSAYSATGQAINFSDEDKLKAVTPQ